MEAHPGIYHDFAERAHDCLSAPDSCNTGVHGRSGCPGLAGPGKSLRQAVKQALPTHDLLPAERAVLHAAAAAAADVGVATGDQRNLQRAKQSRYQSAQVASQRIRHNSCAYCTATWPMNATTAGSTGTTAHGAYNLCKHPRNTHCKRCDLCTRPRNRQHTNAAPNT